MPEFYRDNRDFPGLARGLAAAGLAAHDIEGIMGGNWSRFCAEGFGPA